VLQYIAPIMQLGFGVLVFHEPMPPGRVAAFALVWLALAVFTWDGLRARRARSRAARSAVEDEPTPTPEPAPSPEYERSA